MAKIFNEYYCNNCHAQWKSETEQEHICPNCKEERSIVCVHIIQCDCGTEFINSGNTNICPECGKLFNAFGEELSDPSCWDEEDWYGCFGPQNYYE